MATMKNIFQSLLIKFFKLKITISVIQMNTEISVIG